MQQQILAASNQLDMLEKNDINVKNHDQSQDTKDDSNENQEITNDALQNSNEGRQNLADEPTKAKRQEKYKQLLRPCEMCGKMLEKSRMETHTNQHLNDRPYTCDLCNKKFYSAYTLTSHKRSHHSNLVFVCKLCPKAYTLQKSLYNHEQKHKEPRYTCKVCGRKYKNR